MNCVTYSSRFSDQNATQQDVRYNQWFEETLCGDGVALRAEEPLAAKWESSPPAPRWSEAAKKLRRFFDHLLSEGHRQLPLHTPLIAWLHRKMKSNCAQTLT